MEQSDQAHSNFYRRKGPFSLNDICAKLQRTPITHEDGVMIHSPATLQDGTKYSLGFFANPKYRDALCETKCGAVLLREEDADALPKTSVAIISPNPYRDFCIVTQMLYPDVERDIIAGPHSVDASAEVAPSVKIAAGAVIGANCVIGDGCVIGANAVIDHGVQIGAGSVIGPGCFLGFCLIGKSCLIHSGARIGTRGFGFDMTGNHYEELVQTGLVIVGDYVEIGANTAIDRGAIGNTVIGDQCRIDNLVQIGHNAVLGRGCVIAGNAAIAGSTVLEDRVAVGGSTGIAGHLRIAQGAQIGGCSGVMTNLAGNARYVGVPALPEKQFFRNFAWLRRAASSKKSIED